MSHDDDYLDYWGNVGITRVSYNRGVILSHAIGWYDWAGY